MKTIRIDPATVPRGRYREHVIENGHMPGVLTGREPATDQFMPASERARAQRMQVRIALADRGIIEFDGTWHLADDYEPVRIVLVEPWYRRLVRRFKR
jgi:hypothetical protein